MKTTDEKLETVEHEGDIYLRRFERYAGRHYTDWYKETNSGFEIVEPSTKKHLESLYHQ